MVLIIFKKQRIRREMEMQSRVPSYFYYVLLMQSLAMEPRASSMLKESFKQMLVYFLTVHCISLRISVISNCSAESWQPWVTPSHTGELWQPVLGKLLLRCKYITYYTSYLVSKVIYYSYILLSSKNNYSNNITITLYLQMITYYSTLLLFYW